MKTIVILGVPLTDEALMFINAQEEFEFIDWDWLGFEILDDISDETAVGYCGIELGQWESRDEPYMIFKGGASSDCRIQPPGKREERINLIRNKQREKQAREKVKKLDPRIKRKCGEFGIYFIQA